MRAFERLTMGLSLLVAFGLAGCGTGSDDPFLVSPGELSFTAEIGGYAPASKTITITANESDAEAPGYEYSGAAIEMVVTSGYTDSEITLRVSVPDPDTLGLGTHSGTVTIASSVHSRTVSVTYTVTGGTPAITSASPDTVVAGSPGTVLIGGSGFTRISGTPTVLFGATAAVSAEVISDSVLRAEHPALTAGSHPVSISGSVTFPSTASLTVVEAPGYTAYATPSAGVKSKVVEDVARGAFYVANRDGGTIERYTYDASGSQWTADSVVLSGVRDIALSPDGSRLLAVAGESVYALNPAATTMSAITVTSASLFDYCGERFNNIEFDSSGRALLLVHMQNCTGGLDGYSFDPADDTLTAMQGFWMSASGISYEPIIARSTTGQILAYNDSGISSFNAFDQTLVDTGLPSGDKIATDADASVIVLQQAGYDTTRYVVYNGEYVLQGEINPAATFDAFAVAPDGTRLYAYEAAGGTVTVYDLTSPVSGEFAVVGGPTALATSPGSSTRLAVSRDGQALLFGGDTNVVVAPVSGL